MTMPVYCIYTVKYTIYYSSIQYKLSRHFVVQVVLLRTLRRSTRSMFYQLALQNFLLRVSAH
jgi:hypothetical protein